MSRVRKIPTVPRLVDGAPVPNVSRREMKTLAAIVDEQIERLTDGGTFGRRINLYDAEHMARFRGWLLYVVQHAAMEMEWAYRRAVESALTQADQLMRDPKRYEGQTARRKKRNEEYRARQAVHDEEYRKRQLERAENIRTLAETGKLAVMPHMQIRPRTKPEAVPPPEDER